MILTVFYDDIIFPDILCRRENCSSFRKNIPDGDELHIPSESKVQEKEVPAFVQIEFSQISVV